MEFQMAEKNLNSEDKEFMEELAADGSPSGIESDTEWEQQEPFDPEKISIDSKVISMDALIRRLLQGTIRLAPAFQRKMIWDMKRKSLQSSERFDRFRKAVKSGVYSFPEIT